MLKATILPDDNGERLFLNDVEFPWPLNKWMRIVWWPADDAPGKTTLVVEILVDEVSVREVDPD